MISALYGIVARRIVVVDGEEREELVRCNSVFDLTDLPPLLQEYATAYSDAQDIRIDLDTTPAT